MSVTFGRTVSSTDGEGCARVRRSRTPVRVDGVEQGAITASSHFGGRELYDFSARMNDGSEPGGVYQSLADAKRGVKAALEG